MPKQRHKLSHLRRLVRKFLAVNHESSIEELANYITKHAPALATRVTTKELEEIAVQERIQPSYAQRCKNKPPNEGNVINFNANSAENKMIPSNEAIKSLIERGKRRGVLTYGEIMESLQGIGLTPDEIDSIYEHLTIMGVDVVPEVEDINLTDLSEPRSEDSAEPNQEQVGTESFDAEATINPFYAKLYSFLEFLKHAYCPERIIRDVTKYEEIIFWQDELPLGKECFLSPGGHRVKAWLTVHKQDIPDPPRPPAELLLWLSGGYHDPRKQPEFKKVLNEEAFENDPKRLGLWREYMGKWEHWAEEAKPKRLIQDLYNRLFRLSLRLEREGERLELVWGHGMLYWRFENQSIRHPVLTTKMTVEFDERSGIIKVLPATTLLGSAPTEFTTTFFDGLQIESLINVRSLREELNFNPVNPWSKDKCLELYQRLINGIDPEGWVHFDGRELVPETKPQISHEPVLFLRYKRIGYREDIEKILEGLKAGQIPPGPVTEIIGKDEGESEPKETKPVHTEELFFPLPANDEQRRIAERLVQHIGVTVQGPPGTGKSHTIVNMACHLLAQGKRVLITAQAERPLRVLRKMFPENVRPLCVPVLTDSSGSLDELKEAVRVISENVDSLDKEKTRSDIEKLRQELRTIRERIAERRWRLKEISQRENKRYRFLGQEYSLSALAKWVKEEEDRLGWIPDPLPQEATLPLSQKELVRLYELSGIIRAEDRPYLEQELPDPNTLPSGNDLRSLSQEITRSETELKNGGTLLGSWQVHPNYQFTSVSQLYEDTRQAVTKAEQYLYNPWMNAVFRDAVAGETRRQVWDELTLWLGEKAGQLISLAKTVAEYVIEIPQDFSLAELKDRLTELESHFEKGKLGFFIKRKFRSLLERCKVNGTQIRKDTDVRVILNEIEKRWLQEKIVTRWKNQVVPFGAPELDSADPYLIAKIDDFARTIREVVEWREKVWRPVAEGMKRLELSLPAEITLQSLRKVVRRLEMVQEAVKLKDLRTKWQKVDQCLRSGVVRVGASSLWYELREAFESKAWGKWDETCKRICYLREVKGWHQEFVSLKSRLQKVAPRWTQTIAAAGGTGQPLQPPDNAAEAWEWRKAETLLQQVIADDPSALSAEVESLSRQEEALVGKLVALSTLLGLAERVSEEERSSLIAWQTHVERIGRGTGRWAPRNRLLAQREMQRARGAVPVWIMPLYQLISNFDPTGEPFDVVIADESSQVDLKGILAFFRAKKVLVVGDDKQISPYGIGADRERIHALMEQYLTGIPHKELFGPDSSLYDIAQVFFPGVIMLREHFRCLPEIIQFSNDLMYQGEILPLRKKEPRFGDDWTPVVAVRVENGFRPPGRKINEPEAERLVQQVIQCCEDQRYDGMTMGVISLLGEEQARLIEEMLSEKLGPREMRLRRISCGDAYYFQGDQRDVVFLSMVEAKGEHMIATLNKRNDLRRFNVAASRARNQKWLFYSIDPGDLHPEDVRARLISYCCNPHRVQEKFDNLEELCESEFERRVLRDLLARGYRVQPQVRAGNYRIDLVVYGMNDYLAIECDGEKSHPLEKWEEDWQRQLVLERAGWKFHRIRGSTYFRDPERAVSDVVRALEAAGILPGR